MSFRIRDLEAILFAAIMFCVLPWAKAQSSQSSGGDQNHIIVTSPDGKATSGTPAPMEEAPQAEEWGPPAGQANANIFADPLQPRMLQPMPPPQLLNNGQNQDDSTDPTDIRKRFGVPTAQEMMKLPTEEQIFGLPERKTTDELARPSTMTTGDTNVLSPAAIDEPAWSKMWAGNTGNANSNGTEKTTGLFGGFFDSAARNGYGFGNHDWGSTEDSFGQPQASGGQEQSWEAVNAGATPAPMAPAQTSFSSANNEANGGFNSQSPFLTPQVGRVDTTKALPQLPQLPQLPAVPGRAQVETQPPAAPSWTPKPPPWTQPQTPFGTPVH